MANPSWRHSAIVLSLLLLASLCNAIRREDDDWPGSENYDDTEDNISSYSNSDEWSSDEDHQEHNYKHRPNMESKEKPCQSESPTPPSPTCPVEESPSASPSPSCPKKKSPSPSPSPSCPKQKSPSPTPTSMVPSRSPSTSASSSTSPVPSESPSASASPSPSSSPPPESPSGSPSPSSTPSLSPSPSSSPTPSTTPSPTPSRTPSPTSSPSTSVSPILSTPGPSALPTETPLASICPQPLLGVAAGFSAFVLGNESTAVSGSNATAFSVDLVNGDFESAAAVNGGLRLRSFGVFQNSPCTDQASQGATLIINGPVNVVDTRLFCGNLLVASQSDIIRPPSFQSGNGVVVSNVSIDFSSVRTNLTAVSTSLCALTNATSADTTIFGDVRLRAMGLETEVFTIDVATLARTGFMRLTNVDASVTKSVVINVLGSGIARFSNFFFDTGAMPQGLITWNICSANLVVIENFLFPGTLLAPAAAVTLQKAQVVGSVVASSLTGSGGGQINVARCP